MEHVLPIATVCILHNYKIEFSIFVCIGWFHYTCLTVFIGLDTEKLILVIGSYDIS